MIRNRFYFYTIIAFCLIAILTGCSDDNRDNKEIVRILENNIRILEDGGKIKTFPITIIIADKLSGNVLPYNMQRLCALSKYSCKTLPIAGILRLGFNTYYEYNCISSLEIPDKIKYNETDVTDTIERQVNKYLSTTKLETYDSLLPPNHSDWNLQTLSLEYIGNSADSIFFFSESANSGSLRLGDKSYLVYNNVIELRRKIDEIICRGQKSISVFYTPPPFDSSQATFTKSKWPSKATSAGDTCIGYSKYEKLHNGSGGFITGSLIEQQSQSCGFKFPSGLAGDTCIKGSKYQKLHNGKGGFTMGNLIERNSKDCGFVFPAGPAGDTCISGSRYQKLHNGKGGFTIGNLKERNSRSCGFTYPVGVAGDTCIKSSKYQKLHNGRGGFRVGNLIEVNSKSCGFVFPTGTAGDTCVNGSRYQKLHNGKGGFTVGSIKERNSRSCGFIYPTGVAGDTCISGSKYQKLHNGRGGFIAGRLVERNSKNCGFAYPAAGTAATGYICDQGSKYAKMNNGRGGFVRGALIEANSRQCALTAPAIQVPSAAGSDEASARKSDAVCEKDNSGNYTGRRVQYYYNRSGKVIRTVVISKCDGDCRCLGN